ETDDVSDQSIFCQSKFLEFCCQTETVEQAENQNRKTSVRLKSKETLESIHVVECFVDNRKTDDRVDNVGVRVDAAQHSGEQSEAMPNREKAYVLDDVTQPVEEKYYTDQKQQMIVSGDHMLCTEVQERRDSGSAVSLYESCISLRNVMSACNIR